MPVRTGVDCRRAARGVGVLLMAGLLLVVAPGPARSQEPVTPRPLGRDIAVYRPPDDPRSSRPPAIVNPAGPITLRDALGLALMQSPELAAFAWELRAREARVLQAVQRPNPVIATAVQDLGGSTGFTGADDPIQSQTTIELSQLIELGGKRAARQRLAALERDLAAWDYEAARMDVLTRVTGAYVDVLASQRLVTLAQETTGLVEQVHSAVGLRVAAGVVSPIEQTKADVALAAVRIESDRARRLLEADRRRLAAHWGSPSPAFHSAAGDLTRVGPVPTFDDLQRRLASNPDVARWAAEIAQREAALAVARARRVPDVSVSGGYRRYTEIDSNAFVVGASIELPLFDRNRGGIREAGDRLRKAHEEQRAATVRVTVMLAEAYRALSSAGDEVSALASNVLPGARSAFEAVGEGYRLGKFGYLEVLDAQRTLVSAGGQYLRALADYHKAAAGVERLIGEPLSSVAPVPPTSRQE